VRVLIVDDDEGVRWALARAAEDAGWQPIEAASLAEAEAHLPSADAVLLDIYLPDGDGLNWLEERRPEVPVIVLTAQTTFDHAAEAFRRGAVEYLPKPFDLDEVQALLRRFAPSKRSAKAQAEQEAPSNEVRIIGKSPAMQSLFRTLGRVAASDLTVLITGESGSGKEVVARALHAKSPRANKPFIAVNMAAIPAELAEAELFGHEKGAFTGADRARKGLFEEADGGTLFLDEIGDMPLALQTKLLRVLEEGTVLRVGSRRPVRVNVRLLAATHQNLAEKVRRGEFREDLYYRLNVIPVHVPPLRDRREDIPELAEYLLSEAARKLGITPPRIEPAAMQLLVRHDWPGNVRELKNVMHRLAVLTPGPSITVADVALALGHEAANSQQETLADAVTRCMRQYLAQLGHAEPRDLYRHLLELVEPPLLALVLEQARGNQLRAAEMLGINRNTLRKMLRRYGIDAKSFR